MAKLVGVTYIAPFPRVVVPSLGIDVEQGQTIQVGADAAGRPPGPWEPATADTPAHWPTRVSLDDAGVPVTDGSGVVVVLTHDPGEGLLAQVDNWAPATAVPAPAGPDQSPEG